VKLWQWTGIEFSARLGCRRRVVEHTLAWLHRYGDLTTYWPWRQMHQPGKDVTMQSA